MAVFTLVGKGIHYTLDMVVSIHLILKEQIPNRL